MVCSRPEYHLKQFFSDNDSIIDCWKKEISIDSRESKEDVALFLRDGFREIHRKYSDFLDESWPPESTLLEVIDAASGLFAFAYTVVRYVGDQRFGNPPACLKIAIDLSHSRSPADAALLEILNLIYGQILSEVPPNILPITLQILHSMRFYTGSEPAIVIANACRISCIEFYQALRKLYSVLDIPSPKDGTSHSVKFIHKSFRDFLDYPQHSRRFHWTPHMFAVPKSKVCFHWFLPRFSQVLGTI